MNPAERRAGFDPRRIAPDADALSGGVIAITGPTAGIGRALALECARRGAELILLGRSVRKLEALDAEFASLTRHSGGPVLPAVLAPLDLEKALAGDYDAVAEAIEKRWGRLDGLVHNASQLGQLAPIEQYDVPTWMRVMHVNLNAAFALTQVLMPALRASPDASVLFTSSGVGRRGRAYWGAYAVSKFAVEGLVQVLSAELELTRVRVNAINPGKARTAMRRQAYPSEDAATLPDPASLTNPYVVMLGPQSREITGGSFDAQ